MVRDAQTHRKVAIAVASLITLLFAQCSTIERRPASATPAFLDEITGLAKAELLRLSSAYNVSRTPVSLAATVPAELPQTVRIEPASLQEQQLFPARPRQILRIESLDRLPLTGDQPVETLALDSVKYVLTIGLENHLSYEQRGDLQQAGQRNWLDAKISCDKPITIRRRLARDWKNVTSKAFQVYDYGSAGDRVDLQLPASEVSCTLLFRNNSEEEYRSGIRLTTKGPLSDAGIAGALTEACLYDPARTALTPKEMFQHTNYPGISCIAAAESAELLSESLTAFNKKIAALTGSPLPTEVIQKHHLEYEIDYSRAPRFDAILLSTLEFKSDFYGITLAKVLAWHAKRGTSVRIVVPHASIRFFKKDVELLRGLERESRNAVVQFYRDESSAAVSINRHHRVIHAKMLIGLSHDNPGHDFVIVGGRNVKDTFIYERAPNYRSRPALEQYGSLFSPFSFFDDLEVLIHGRSVARQTASQFLAFWHRDHRTMRLRPPNVHLPVTNLEIKPAEGTVVRHVFSVPYADGRQLESMVVDLINSSRKSLRLVSPYFRPTRRIGKAITDAAARGVKVRFLTELELSKDNSPRVTMELNRQSINRFQENIDIYVASDKRSILHTKAILADDEVLFISGVNLNNRSFKHDVENGFLIADADLCRQFKQLFDDVYLPNAQRILGRLRVKWLDRLIIPMVEGYF